MMRLFNEEHRATSARSRGDPADNSHTTKQPWASVWTKPVAGFLVAALLGSFVSPMAFAEPPPVDDESPPTAPQTSEPVLSEDSYVGNAIDDPMDYLTQVLNDFGHFSFGDLASANHIYHGIAVQGDLTQATSGINPRAGSVNYVGGEIAMGTYIGSLFQGYYDTHKQIGASAPQSDWPTLYLSTANAGKSSYDETTAGWNALHLKWSNDYIDFEHAQAQLTAASQQLATGSLVDINDSATWPVGVSYDANYGNGTLTIPAHTSIRISAEQFSALAYVNFTSSSGGETICGGTNLYDSATTVTIVGQEVAGFPRVQYDGKHWGSDLRDPTHWYSGSYPSGDSMGVIWNMPDVTHATWNKEDSYPGHILAPKAQIDIPTSGNIDGTIIAADIAITGATETHRWGYRPRPTPEVGTGTGELSASKSVVDADGNELDINDYDGAFTFSVAYSGDLPQCVTAAPMPSNGASVTNQGTAVNFGTITFTYPGTYTYTVSETQSTAEGVIKDDSVFTVVFDVSGPNADGSLTVSRTIGKGDAAPTEGESIAFVNTKSEGSQASVRFKARKNLEGLFDAGKGIQPGQYSFRVFEIDKDELDAYDPATFDDEEQFWFLPETSEDGVLQEVVNMASEDNGKSANVEFAPIEYTKDDVGEHYYVIYEAYPSGDIGDADGPVPDITYDLDIALVTVTVAQHSDGSLSATATYRNDVETKDVETAVFNNRYGMIWADMGLRGLKYLDGQTPQDGMFQFRITPVVVDGSPLGPLPKGVDEQGVVSNKGEGTIQGGGIVNFGEFEFIQAGVYWYKVEEIAGGDATITYDPTIYWVRWNITADADEGISPELYLGSATAPDLSQRVGEETVPVFDNSTKPTPEPGKIATGLQLRVLKLLRDSNGKTRQFKGKFTFELVDSSGTVVQTATTDANGWVRFNALNYSVGADVADGVVKRETYTIREVDESATQADLIYDRHVTTVAVTVSKSGGVLTATADYDNTTIETGPDMVSVTQYGVFVNREKPDEPEKPEEPEEPEETEKPTITEKPNTSGKGAATTTTRLSRTGIEVASAFAATMLLLIAGVTVLAINKSKKRG